MNMRDHLRRRILRRKYLPRPEFIVAKDKAGNQPTIFTDFLLDCAVFLDPFGLMSSYLPDLKEMVVTVPMAREVARDHSILVSRLTAYAKEEKAVDLRYSARHYNMGFLSGHAVWQRRDP